MIITSPQSMINNYTNLMVNICMCSLHAVCWTLLNFAHKLITKSLSSIWAIYIQHKSLSILKSVGFWSVCLILTNGTSTVLFEFILFNLNEPYSKISVTTTTLMLFLFTFWVSNSWTYQIINQKIKLKLKIINNQHI